jgi:hypothetical protein
MTYREPSRVPLAHVQLGDVIILPDRRAMTARGRVTLETPIGSMAGFIICNDLEILLSTPATTSGPVNVYVPINYMPHAREHLSEAARGVFSYWAPHLPAISGAMGELGFRVFKVRGSVDPVVLVYRGQEPIVFVRASFTHADDLEVLCMDRSTDNEMEVVRLAAIVDDPSRIPAPVEETRRSLYRDMVC